jgi:hypothetical protein
LRIVLQDFGEQALRPSFIPRFDFGNGFNKFFIHPAHPFSCE